MNALIEGFLASGRPFMTAVRRTWQGFALAGTLLTAGVLLAGAGLLWAAEFLLVAGGLLLAVMSVWAWIEVLRADRRK